MPFPGPSYGETARPWSAIVEFYDGLASQNVAFADLARLARGLAHSPYPAAGLYALTSMHDLILGPSAYVLDNPHLVVAYLFPEGQFRLEYRDGSTNPWHRTATPHDIYRVVERFLLKRARWFRASVETPDPGSSAEDA